MPHATVNPIFRILGGVAGPQRDDPRYIRYRKDWTACPAAFTTPDFPLHLDIEASNRCNLDCTFCDRRSHFGREREGNMDLALYRRIIDEGAAHGLCAVKLSYRGEPLLHPDLPEMVRYAKKHGVLDVFFNTNGTLLTEAKVRALIDAGLDRLSVSVEGTDPAAYEAARRGARFDRVLANLERLMDIRRALGVDFPRVRVQTVALPHIDLDAYARFWAPRCDETAANRCKDTADEPQGLPAPDFACAQLWQRMSIEWDGAMHPCNDDNRNLFALGNAADTSLRDAWHAPAVEKARETHRAGRSHELPACAACSLRALLAEDARTAP